MSHQSSTPVKVPTSAATYTPAMQDLEMRSQINTLLLREGHTTKIQEQFLHSLDAHPSNWPSTIQSHALSLLRSGEITTFPALVRRVLEDVRRDTTTAAAAAAVASEDNKNGNDGGGGGGKNNNKDNNNNENNNSLAIPSSVVETVLKLVREALDDVCEMNDEAAGG
ncbi:hypothetical protein GGS20DRAFT_253341 [Poronia punctata]|nr:hypothetical protein GGS20DRAFT_253341 [Poronia punctata]